MSVNTAPYGSWKSPITADLIVANTIGLADVYLEGQNLYWQELRPAEGGRNVVMQLQADDSFQERTPTDFNVRTRVHEYGGGSFTIANSRIYGANFADQRLYQIQVGQAPKPLTPDLPLRYADGRVGIKQQIWIGVREDHRDPKTVTNTIVAIPLGREEHEGEVLVEGNDFYAAPRISPDGKYLAWLTWNHPNMPWDNTELWVAPLLPNATLGEPQRIAGGTNESIAQPVWSPDNQLYFVSDRSNWWNIYGWSPTGGKLRHVCAHKAEFTQPQWVFDASTYGFSSAAEIICTFTQQGSWYLGRINVQTGELTPIPCPYTEIGSLRVSGQRAAFIAASPTELPALITLDLQTETLRIVRRSSDLSLDPGYLAIPESISFPTADGRAAYGLYYAPQNRDVAAAPTERPPLLVKSHGGPTAAARCGLSLGIQYWTSRGIAVLDVNYGGSTGYGREYRQSLQGQWGIIDVQDCAYGAQYLVERGDVDGDRLTIDGGSAGGYTTLCALTFTNRFRAGASRYGVSDLKALAEDTHKFESRYLDSLIGPYPERQDLYAARSPINAVDQLNCPVIFLQGLEDRIVPPNQAEMMVEALRAKGIPVAYVAFEGEQHGFRKAENIKRSLEAELYFFAQVFGFELADQITPVAIDNLKAQLPV